MLQWDITTAGIQDLKGYFDRYFTAASEAAVLAINDTARKTRTAAKKEILNQVNFPKNYLGSERDGRLAITKYAKTTSLSATIEGRFRPTSLARFVTNKNTLYAKGTPDGFVAGRGSAKIRIKPGSTAIIDKAYLVRLKGGNEGLAIRPGKGGVTGSTAAQQIGNSRWFLLYGPSVNQVFNTVREDVQPYAVETLQKEFDRQFKRLSK